MNKNEIDKAFVSEYDKFLRKFDATHKKSASQMKEIEKHQRIAAMRDNADNKEDSGTIWKDF